MCMYVQVRGEWECVDVRCVEVWSGGGRTASPHSPLRACCSSTSSDFCEKARQEHLVKWPIE